MIGHTVKITSDGTSGHLEIDGHDITEAVRAVVITLEGHNLPQMSLDLRVWNLETETRDTVVQLPPGTRDALYALGWTPPDGEPG